MRLLLLLIAITFLSLTGRTQNVAVGLQTGVSIFTGSGTALGVPAGINAEWAFDAKHSFSGRAQYNIGLRVQDPDFFYISPEYKYHVIGETLDGFYIGAFMGFGGGGGSGYFSAGAVTGYSVPVGDRFNIEANIQVGWGTFANFNAHFLHLIPTFGARYTF